MEVVLEDKKQKFTFYNCDLIKQNGNNYFFKINMDRKLKYYGDYTIKENSKNKK